MHSCHFFCNSAATFRSNTISPTFVIIGVVLNKLCGISLCMSDSAFTLWCFVRIGMVVAFLVRNIPLAVRTGHPLMVLVSCSVDVRTKKEIAAVSRTEEYLLFWSLSDAPDTSSACAAAQAFFISFRWPSVNAYERCYVLWFLPLRFRVCYGHLMCYWRCFANTRCVRCVLHIGGIVHFCGFLFRSCCLLFFA